MYVYCIIEYYSTVQSTCGCECHGECAARINSDFADGDVGER